MHCKADQQYNVIRKLKLLKEFGDRSPYWKPINISRLGGMFVDNGSREAHDRSDFSESAPQKYYLTPCADKFSPYTCSLNYAWSKVVLLALTGTYPASIHLSINERRINLKYIFIQRKFNP